MMAWGRRGALILVAASLLSGCAQFPENPPGNFRSNPTLGAGPEPTPELPATPQPSKPAGPAGDAPRTPPAPCADPDPAVVATCLDPTAGLVLLPDGKSALVTERRTGRLLKLAPQQAPVELARLPVNGEADGGLLDVALSPTYAQDGLIYLYLTTATDNRVMRIVVGDVPKPVLIGIPRGPQHNTGAITFDARGNLLVATGDAGVAASANDPTSLAGKLLRITATGTPAPGNPAASSPVVAAGLAEPGGVCTDAVSGASWLTDRTPTLDRLRSITANGSLGPDVWTWPDRPGAAGCAARQGRISVSLTTGAALYVLTTAANGSVTAPPEVLVKDRYGQLFGADVGPDGVVWAGSVNKAGGKPGATDDRVVRIQPPSGESGASAA
jgi:glucose/arabinose dehydrogenase